jgi:hypothetical protein
MGFDLLEFALYDFYNAEQLNVSDRMPENILLFHSGQTAIIEVKLPLIWTDTCDFKKIQDVHNDVAQRIVGLGFVLVEAIVIIFIQLFFYANGEKNCR